MSAKPPPVPPRNRNGKAPEARQADPADALKAAAKPGQRNLKQQGRQGNIKQNTTNQGHQQDR